MATVISATPSDQRARSVVSERVSNERVVRAARNVRPSQLRAGSAQGTADPSSN
jgi:hypothetical protein